MRLYFIRHGQSVNNALWDETGKNYGRSVDAELTQKGHQQAQLLADFIVRMDADAREKGGREPRRDSFAFTHLYTSLMVRAVATASYVSRAIGLPLHAWPEIHEGGGIYEWNEETNVLTGLPGNPRSYFQQNYQHLHLPDSLTEAGWWNRPFESDQERPLRAQRVLEALLERHGNTQDRVAIVSHGGFYMELSRAIFRIREPKSWFLMYNTAISRFDFDDATEVRLVYHNRTDHLPDQLIS